ncbi:MAG: GNAT family N-acetyltransferase [Mycobacterium sp.]|nr:GNAT family N-acetyltransferase [Mycobacterium sp.]
MKDRPIELVTARLLLREFRRADHFAVHAYVRDPEVTRYTDWGPDGHQATAAFLAEMARNAAARPRTDYSLAAVERTSGVLVGAVHLGLTNQAHRLGEMGYVLAPLHWGKGYATEAATATLRFGFRQVGLHKITATCDPDNITYARFLSKIGMLYQDYVREHVLVRGRWRDRLLFAAISPLREYEPPCV